MQLRMNRPQTQMDETAVRLLRVVFITSIEPLENNRQCLETIKQTLKKGISVCIFTTNQDICRDVWGVELAGNVATPC